MRTKQVFLDYCNDLIRLAIPLLDGEMESSGLVKLEVGHGIDYLGPPHPVGETWLSEPYQIYAKARNSKSGEDETVQISICAGNAWNPVLSVSSTSLDPVMFETTGSAEKDIAMIRAKIAECFARLKAD